MYRLHNLLNSSLLCSDGQECGAPIHCNFDESVGLSLKAVPNMETRGNFGALSQHTPECHLIFFYFSIRLL